MSEHETPGRSGPDDTSGAGGQSSAEEPGVIEPSPDDALALEKGPEDRDELGVGRGRFLTFVLQGNTVVVTMLSLLVALVVGGLLNAFTNTTVLHAWGNLFSDPGHAIASAWDTAVGAYIEMFEGSIFNPHTVSALFQQASFSSAIHDGYLSAVFNPLSETCVQATPLILAGLAVALPYQAGLFNIGGQSQFIGGAIMAAWLGYYLNLPFFEIGRAHV